MDEFVGNALGATGAVVGPMLFMYWWFPRKLRFVRRLSVSLTGILMIVVLVWIYLHR
jgi:hypothetical protein